jgi:hypothetical protein
MEIKFGARVGCDDGYRGHVDSVVLDSRDYLVEDVVIDIPRLCDRLVRLPTEKIALQETGLHARCRRRDLSRLSSFMRPRLLAGPEFRFPGAGGQGDQIEGGRMIASTPCVLMLPDLHEGEVRLKKRQRVRGHDECVGRLVGIQADRSGHLTEIEVRHGRRFLSIPVAAIDQKETAGDTVWLSIGRDMALTFCCTNETETARHAHP